MPKEKLHSLITRFERAGPNTTRRGLGLANVTAISERIGSELFLNFPRVGKEDGFEVRTGLPVSISDP